MYYIAPNRYYSFWQMLRTMVMENYETPEMAHHVLIFGDYIFRSVDEIKKTINRKFDKLIIYQLEPLVPNHWWDKNRLIQNLKGADEVWDYDLQNVEILLKHGINAKFKPMRYSPSLKRIPKNDNPDIDVLFYGNFTDYRAKFINWFFGATNPNVFYKMNFVWLQHFLDDKLDEFISRSKIILNLNPYIGETRQQQTRIFYPLINNKCVISQTSEINYFGDSILEFTNEHSVNSLILNLLTDEKWKTMPCSNKSFLFDTNKIAIFYHIGPEDNWKNTHINILTKLQQLYWYDGSDYIHFGIEDKLPIPYLLLKVNRLANAMNKNHTLQQMILFSKLNPDYNVFYIDNENDFDIENDFPFFEMKGRLNTQNLVFPNKKLRNFIATAEYVSTLDTEFLDQPLTQDQYINWLHKSNI